MFDFKIKVSDSTKKKARRILVVVVAVIILGTMTALITSAFLWANRADLYRLKYVEIRGNFFLSKSDVLHFANISLLSSLTELNLEEIQSNLETHPFIKGANVSKIFPNTVRVVVAERNPIAYVNLYTPVMISEDGFILPTENDMMELNLPMLTGFNSNEKLYTVGQPCQSSSVLLAKDVLNEMKKKYSSYYNEISEVIITQESDFVLYLTKYPTRIILNTNEWENQLILLDSFAETIEGTRTIYNYQYIDLRYNDQIVVKERV